MPRFYDNVWQGKTKKVLCLCSANMLRSPTMQVVLSMPPYDYNTRSAGTYDFALIPLTDELIGWADEIVCADTEHVKKATEMMQSCGEDKPVVNLRIPDNYEYRNPELIGLIKKRYDEIVLNKFDSAEDRVTRSLLEGE